MIYGDSAFAYAVRDGLAPTAPITLHLPGDVPADSLDALLALARTHTTLTVSSYPGTAAGFALPGGRAHDPQNATMAYSRTVCVLKAVMGPYYNLEELWEYHLAYGFRDHDTDHGYRALCQPRADPDGRRRIQYTEAVLQRSFRQPATG